MLTLREAKKLVANVEMEKGERMPSFKRVCEGEEAVLIAHVVVDGETEISLYQSGFVVYRAGGRGTIFPLHDCDSYIYEISGSKVVLLEDVFEEQPWFTLPVLIGEDRIFKNVDAKYGLGHYVVSYNAFSPNFYKLECPGEILQGLIREEFLKELWSCLPEKQKKVLFLRFWENMSVKCIARELGVSPQAVSDATKKAFQKLKRTIGEEQLRAYLDELSI